MEISCSFGKEASKSHRGFYVLLLGNAFLLVGFLDISLDRFLFLHDASEEYEERLPKLLRDAKW
jgi:hypothetical protein